MKVEPHMIPVPPQVPQSRSRFWRWVGVRGLALMGWRFEGEIPDIPKAVVIVAPHSSNWDGLIGFFGKLALGLRITFVAKRELFFWPVGGLLRRMGFLPVDRRAAGSLVHQVASRLRAADSMWFGLTPEGTRSRVEKWKSGFWHIAHASGVPIVCAYFHYPARTMGFGPVVHTSDDPAADMARIRAFYVPWMGKRRGTV
ncbi:lysophospholipid acyltransferase family protein [Coralloluteibacterium thermophilus]|uniref:Lysophospholipid acyltransferase family protein n=1 Tax=Coralloluteibacterium thermophilum TaxID=2707049 RepID=A0ABV9NLG9_9GAMM